jgi:cell division protein FtsQ
VRGNVFLVDLSAVQRRVEALPWVQRASVRRLFPHDIAIRFSEQQLAARWSDRDWLNTSGEVLRVGGGDLPNDLPRLDGPTGTSAQVYRVYQQFRARLAPLDVQLVGLSLSARRSWQLELQPPNGHLAFTLVVDHDQPLPRLERFVRVYATAFTQRVAGIKRVDLRYTNGFAVRWYPEHAQAHTARTAPSRNEG